MAETERLHRKIAHGYFRPARWLIGIAVAIGVAVVVVQSSFAQNAKPNILIIVADDLGYCDLGCFGSEIPTPNLDGLAKVGTLFTDFHVAATCSPTRAMLWTGVDHHRAGMGSMYEYISTRYAPNQIGKPGYEGYLNARVATLAEVLRPAGYHTSIAGKWHQSGARALGTTPFGRGFDRSWILWDGWSESFVPESVTPQRRMFVADEQVVAYPNGTYATSLYTDKMVEFIGDARKQQKPFFAVAAYTAPHWPLEAPNEWLEKQRGKYDDGFDELRKRRIATMESKGIIPAGIRLAANPELRPYLHHERPSEATQHWSSMNAEQRRYSARLMEAYAAMVEAMDHEIGRLFAHLQETGQFDNTLIIFMSDNGAAEMASEPGQLPGSRANNRFENIGHQNSFVGYGPEWARASTGPWRMLKGYPGEGGIRAPCIVKMPASQTGAISHEFTSVLDLAPTLYEVAKAEYPPRPGPPRQFKTTAGKTEELQPAFVPKDLYPLAGTSLVPYLTRQSEHVHPSDYAMGWELFGRAAYRKGNWKILWAEKPFGTGAFELFDLSRDPGEAEDVHDKFPEIYRELIAGWEQYAKDVGVVLYRPESPAWH